MELSQICFFFLYTRFYENVSCNFIGSYMIFFDLMPNPYYNCSPYFIRQRIAGEGSIPETSELSIQPDV